MKKYYAEDHSRLKIKFPQAETIANNFSQTFQDMFVLSMLNGKRDGYFLEIGANHPINISNSYLLESNFGWKGISIDLDPQYEPLHREARRTNTFITGNALKIDYRQVLRNNKFPKQVDYLQIDIDPASQSLNCLKLMPMDEYRFSVITFETDVYQGCPEVREESRQILKDHDYILIAGNITNESNADPYEDWWVDPKAIDHRITNFFSSNPELNIPGDKFLLS